MRFSRPWPSLLPSELRALEPRLLVPPDPDLHERDHGLRTMLMWTFIALVASILLAVLGVKLVIHFFDRPAA